MSNIVSRSIHRHIILIHDVYGSIVLGVISHFANVIILTELFSSNDVIAVVKANKNCVKLRSAAERFVN